jgi:asparagine synthetase B (glutamine-hydrolysing)
MCGIYCEIRRDKHSQTIGETEKLLRQRGPDHYGCVQQELAPESDKSSSAKVYMTFAASVLGLRRDQDDKSIAQPLALADSRGFLCWNGEAWKYDNERITGSDTKFISEKLNSVPLDADDFHERTLDVFSKICGPFAFIYCNKPKGMLYYGRDCVGRRSLLRSVAEYGYCIVSSVADRSIVTEWKEVEADGIYMINLSARMDGSHNAYATTKAPWSNAVVNREKSIPVPWPLLNIELPSAFRDDHASSSPPRLNTNSKAVASLHLELLSSMQLRLPERTCTGHPSVAILFSGGLDCTLLARLAHECLHQDITIDLLNVAFENPRIHKNINGPVSAYETCPDRITARQSQEELQQVCPGRRFSLVCINIPYTESLKCKDEIKALIYPHDTEMDISIAMALFFAARGPTESKFLLSGLGADELFGGYQRHALAYRRGGYSALLEELQLDTDRLGKRNLGRDDRVISRWGKEARYPFLDEAVIAWAMRAPIWEKVGFDFNKSFVDTENVILDDKLILRCIVKKLRMSGVAEEKKRAIQFGSRSAKMESGRTKGTEKIS